MTATTPRRRCADGVPGSSASSSAPSRSARRRRRRPGLVGLLVGALALGAAAATAQPAVAGGRPAARPAVALPPGPALATTADTSWWGTNGRVEDIVSDGSSAWLAGGFDYVGPTTGHAVTVEGAGGAVTSGPGTLVDGPVLAAVPDGTGGYYLGGSFARVGDQRRTGLAHVTSAGAVDKRWSGSATTGTVSALAVGPTGTLYVGWQDGSTGAAHLDAFNPDGTTLAGFSAAVDAPVSSLDAVGGSVYAGGSFTSVGGVGAAHVARFDGATGALDPTFAVGTDDTVLGLDVLPGATRGDDVVALGGRFGTVTDAAGPHARARFATVSGSGADRGWAADTDGEVRSVAVDPATSTVVLGGTFTRVGGQARSLVGRVSLAGAVTSFAPVLAGCQVPHTVQDSLQFPSCTPQVDSVAVAGSRVYVGGLFTTSGGVVRHDAAAYDAASGALDPWTPLPGAWTHVVRPLTAATTGPVVLGGEFTSVGGQYHRGLARLDLATGKAVAGFRADTDDLPLDLELSGGRLYAAGSFATVAGLARKGLVSLDPATGAVSATFVPQPNRTVYSIAVRGTKVYLGGLFTSVGGQAYASVARVDSTTGKADTTWHPVTAGPGGAQKNGAVFSVAARQDGTRVFLSGGFTSVGGVATPGGIAAVDGSSGAVLPRNLGGVVAPPAYCNLALNWIQKIYLSADDQRLYGGDACPDGLYQWDAVNLAASKTNGLNWTSQCNGGIQGRLEVNGHFYYGTHGGDKGAGGWCYASSTDHTQVLQQRLFVFRPADAAVLGWLPQFDSPMGVWSFAAVPQGLLVGGDFTFAGDRSTVQQGLALFRGTP